MIVANKNVDLRIALKIGIHKHVDGMGACPARRITECGRLTAEEVKIVEQN